MIRRQPTVNSVNVLFLIVGILLLLVGSRVQKNDLYTGLLITEYLIILLPNIIFIKFKRLSLKKVLKLNRLSFKQVVYIFFIMLFAYPVAIFLNFIVLAMVTSISQAIPVGMPIPDNFIDYMIGIFVVAITPGICEEVMFRGTLQTAYSSLGEKKGLIITSLLFGVFHFNLLNLLGPIFLGLVLGIIMIKTNSLYGPILGHVLNNGFALTMGYILLQLTDDIDLITKDAPLIDNNTQEALTAILLASFALFAFIGLYILLRNLPVTKKVDSFDLEEGGSIENIDHKELVSYGEGYVKERIMWSPILIIVTIFIYSNWFYFFY